MSEPVQLTRAQLYELVWTTPKLQLSGQLGISDVAIAKRCRKLQIPIPPRGYWAKRNAGLNPRRPSLPERAEQYADQHSLCFDPGSARQSSTAPIDAWLQRIAQIDLPPFTSMSEAHPIVRRTALALKYPGAHELPFANGAKVGPIVAVDVTPAALERALKLADTLLRTGLALGWEFTAERPKPEPELPRYGSYYTKPEPPPAPPKTWPGHFVIDGESVPIRIEERLTELPRTPTTSELAREKREYAYHAPRTSFQPTGKLRVVRIGNARYYGNERRSWYDRSSRPVEDCIPEILLAFQQLAGEKHAQRLEDEERERLRKIKEQRAEALRERREANAARIAQLDRLIGAWHRARLIRQFHRALARTHPDEGERSAWMIDYANQVDPLHPVDRDPDWEPSDSPYWQQDESELKRSLSRLMGQGWHKVEKIRRRGKLQPEDS